MRTWAWIVNIVMCLVVLYPAVEAVGDRKWDSFPLSWYPMFSQPRGPYETPRYAYALDAKGAKLKIPYTYWTGGGFNQGSMQLKKFQREKKGGLKKLCPKIAKRVARRKGTGFEATHVVIAMGWYDTLAYFNEGKTEPHKERILAKCPVTR